MPACVRNGCKKEFNEDDNGEDACLHHPGKPVFHEGLKSWSCCADVNKPELDFDEFVKIQGCQKAKHLAELPKPAPKARTVNPGASVSNTPSTQSNETKEVLEADAKKDTFQVNVQPAMKPTSIIPAAPAEEEDDLSAPVPVGTKCRRKGCDAPFVSDEESRNGDGESAVCTYHPAQPIFHEGSKGYLCCKRRVLEFDEFLKIEGCKKGKHVFVPKKREEEEVITTCRIDHYQTPSDVCVAVFAKRVDKARSVVTFEETQVLLDLVLPDSKRIRRSINLYGPIIPTDSTFTILGTKVELMLKKKDGRSWNILEATDADLGNFNLTFGVGGRTGTIGAREAVLDASNKLNP